jgi:hypothetical protein
MANPMTRSIPFASINLCLKESVSLHLSSSQIFQRRRRGSLQKITGKVHREAQQFEEYSGESQRGAIMVMEREVSCTDYDT